MKVTRVPDDVDVDVDGPPDFVCTRKIISVNEPIQQLIDGGDARLKELADDVSGWVEIGDRDFDADVQMKPW